MPNIAEKRVCARCQHEAPIICGYFNSDYYCPAETFNHSRDGIYIETDFSFRPGATVYIRLDNRKQSTTPSGKGVCEGHPTVALAEVKWRKKLLNSGNSVYGVGLKYYQPAF